MELHIYLGKHENLGKKQKEVWKDSDSECFNGNSEV